MEELLPFELIKREILVKKEAETNPQNGCFPEERPIQQYIDYGTVNINKPVGPSSHQIADYVKKILNLEKVGHGGTLDPGVNGVLPIALGRATRIVQALLPAGKEYVCVMHLHSKVMEEMIRETAKKFTGQITQLPPVRSAVKRQLRQRNIYYFKLIEIDGQDVLFKLGCQGGTYVRKFCLHPKTEILSKEGIITSESFHSNPSTIYSMNRNRIIEKSPIAVQKIPSPRDLIKITTSSRIELIITSDHKLLKSTEEGYKMIEAKKLKEGDFLVKSLKFPQINKKFYIADLLDDKYLIAQPEIKAECKKAFLKKYKSIRAMYRELKLDRKVFLSNSKNSITIRHLKLSGIYDQVKSKINKFKTEKGRIIKLGKLTPDHLYLLGLIASDGNNTKEKNTIRHTRLKFHNIDEVLINKFLEIYKKLFPNIQILKRIVQNDNLFQLDTSNSLFATIAASLGIKSPHKHSDIKQILYFEPKFIRAFLRGYFDGDGSCYFKKKQTKIGHYTNINLISVSYTNIKRLHQMLLKLNIPNKIFKRTISGRRFNTGLVYIIHLESLAAKQKFINEIGTNSPHKRKILTKISKLYDGSKVKDHYYIGLHYKEYLRKTRKSLKQIGGNLSRVLTTKIPITHRLYNRCSSIVKLPPLDQFIIEKIISIEHIKGVDYVYDMTVPQTHNFLIETGFVSSNCHDFGLALGTRAHMAELVRTKAGPFSYKNWITLHDLKDAHDVWKESNDESQLRKVIKPVEVAITHLPKIWVFDNAVDTLCNGAALSLPGISKLESGINVNELVAVMSLKDELICLGTARMDSEAMQFGQKGLAVSGMKVFMNPDTYPKFKKSQ